MARLSTIAFRLPTSAESRAWLDDLCTLLADVEYATDSLLLRPPLPQGALPVTAFELSDVPAPQVELDTGHTLACQGDNPPAAHLRMAELTRRLARHVSRVDHTGVNLPSSATSPEQWQRLVSGIAAASTMYRYPTGEDWPFVLPSTADELADDVRDFVVGREPRFELVYDQALTQTEWQIALWTDLSRAELEALVPEGITFPNLADIFRVVRVTHPWPGLSIRFDLFYRIDGGAFDWETGKWLVVDGGRLRSLA